MIIKLLGTAAFEGIPALFCNCEICRESRALDGRNIRKRSSAIIDNKIALDFTNDTLSHVIDYNLDLSQLEHLFITHSHSDHFNYYDLKAKLGWFTNSGNPVLNVYANENCVDLAYSNVKYCDTVNEYIKFTTIQPFSSVKIGGYLVTAVPARHITYFPEEKALLYLIEHNNRRVFYGLDSGWYLDETWDYLSGVHLDCLIMDCTNGIFQHEVGNHMGLPDNLKVVKRLLEMGTINRDTRVISTHFSHNGKVVYSKHADEFARSGILMAYDGMELEI